MKINEIINESASVGGTASGAIATVAGGGPAITRGASIYGHKKKKKTNEESDNDTITIDTPRVEFEIKYDDRFGIRKWFLQAFQKSGAQDSYVFTKDNKFTRNIPVKMVGFHDYMPFATSNEAQMALKNSKFYKGLSNDR